MQFLTSTPTFASQTAAVAVWERLRTELETSEGIAYYRHPVFAIINPKPPDFAIIARNFEPFVVVIAPYRIDELHDISDAIWSVNGSRIDSPLLELDDHIEGLRRRLATDRDLRSAFKPYGTLALPLISKPPPHSEQSALSALCERNNVRLLYADSAGADVLRPLRLPIVDRIWALTLSVLQNVAPLNKPHPELADTSNRVGEAIAKLEREIAILDNEQHKVAVEIAPGPQRIRGLAGTGKTVVLALKAANLAVQFPDAKILFTFSTQSLYRQVTDLITRFYRPSADADPNWTNLHIRHGWGSSSRPGVYSDICSETGVTPLTLTTAKQIDSDLPFRACCNHALRQGVPAYYDYILVDEAQDFPPEMFRLLHKRAKGDKRLYFAYDELQNLSAVETPSPTDMFGTNDEGEPLVDLTGEYGSGIEKDFVLHKSYRCPLQTLVLAHAIGLGIKDDSGKCYQMIDNASSWESFGYEIVTGNLKRGEYTEIRRTEEHSPNRLPQIYSGTAPLILSRVHNDREAEIKSVADEIMYLVQVEGVRPEDIVVTALLNGPKAWFMKLQRELLARNVDSTIPGLVQNSWAFGEKNSVTLSTLRRAKGNEAPVVFIMGFETLYDYIDPIESRNKAFTAMSRAKGWLRVSGVGQNMNRAQKEINDVLADKGSLCFTFPDMKDLTVRRLDASDTTERRKEVASAVRSVQQLNRVDVAALRNLDRNDLKELLRKLGEAAGDA